MDDDYPRAGLSARGRAVALVRAARATDSPARFIRREVATRVPGRSLDAAARRNVGSYRLRRYDAELSLRHGTLDVPLFFDIMVQHHYQPPGAVLATVDGGVRVVDLGANIGLFAAFIASRLPVASLVAYEPDPTCLDLLGANLGRCPDLRDWRVVEACAGVAEGDVPFLGGQFRDSRVMSGDAAAGGRLPMVDVFPDLQEADLVKIDIEGSEWEILGDPRLRDLPARAIALEYHAWRCPGPNPRQMAIDALAEAGFEISAMREHVPGYGELWAWRPTPA